ncbi:glycosyl hydrolase [Plebeiibacterium marinum]|uniref:Glycosyl hydrolase n=1 Tax=Plebeiibacterium marinum TaxID=2992111 RepID=A0AAE3MFS5_9BACT|nr:glycosyl hydrolase [Plebeiobacterium marinum]MCW3807043.1 glycosyl hydrolase [Plebeiobacterium marinum]
MKGLKFKIIRGFIVALCMVCAATTLYSQNNGIAKSLETSFINPDYSYGPWVVWHWTSANQTKEGITSNLEGMAEAGIAGATLFSFPSGGMGSGGGTKIDNPAEPLTPEWFELIDYAVKEANRLGIKLAIQISAGWATAGGDWITPDLSQQQIVWSEKVIEGGKQLTGKLEQPKRTGGTHEVIGIPEKHPESWDKYYHDLNVLAYKMPDDWGETNISKNAKVTTNLPISDISKLLDSENTNVVLKTEAQGYIQFEFENPFLLRSIRINSGGTLNIPAHTMEVQKSNDGKVFTKVGNLDVMLSGHQTQMSELTHTIQQSKAKYFRLVYHPAPPVNYDEHMVGASFTSGGFGPKRKGDPIGFANLKEMTDPISLASVTLSSTAIVHHWQGKTALTWGKSRRVTNEDLPREACIPLDGIIDLTDKMDAEGNIYWEAPKGKWKIMRFGYTTMARTNGSGAGQGLEPDKFRKEGAQIAFKGYYERILDYVGKDLSDSVVTMLNIDSWECGSQNWSPIFKEEFKKRRGYDLTKYLPLMAGIPIEDANVTESFLFDVRRTIADLISDNFFGELQRLAHEKGDVVNTEVTNPTMTSDGLLVYKNVDETSSEFWCDKWNCWKPCDIRDAVSGAHIYGKKIVIAEAFTGGRNWKEDPYGLKALGDMHYVDGINRMMIHLWAGQPYLDKKPGFTGAAGLYFNENTPWIKPGREWIDYLRRAQVMLQNGISNCDALYFIGEDVPCRALLPSNYGSYFVMNPALPEGYKYDSVNQDALLNLATVKDGRIVLPSGVSYRVLVLHPDRKITLKLAKKIKELIASGAQVVGAKPLGSISLESGTEAQREIKEIVDEVWGDLDGVNRTERTYGAGRVFWGLPMDKVLSVIGVEPDLIYINQKESLTGQPFKATAYQPAGVDATSYGPDRKGWGLMWNHRSTEDCDFYFLSNQEQKNISTEISVRQTGKIPELWHPDSGLIEDVAVWREEKGRTIIPYTFDPSGSVFLVFRKSSESVEHLVNFSGQKGTSGLKIDMNADGSGYEKWCSENGVWSMETNKGKSVTVKSKAVPEPKNIDGEWDVTFPLLTGEVRKVKMKSGSWTDSEDDEIKHFSGTATYSKEFELDKKQFNKKKRLFLDLGKVANLAKITINGTDIGVVWKPPYKIEITNVVKQGKNTIKIEVSNTWYNRLVYDAGLPKSKRQTWLGTGILNGGVKKKSELIPAGLLEPVRINTWVKVK